VYGRELAPQAAQVVPHRRGVEGGHLCSPSMCSRVAAASGDVAEYEPGPQKVVSRKLSSRTSGGRVRWRPVTTPSTTASEPINTPPSKCHLAAGRPGQPGCPRRTLQGPSGHPALSQAGAGCGGYPQGRLHKPLQNPTLHLLFKTWFF